MMPALANTQYTCPMHPEVIREAPGDCPICGMALGLLTISLEDDSDPELDNMTRRLRVCVVLSVPLVILAMGELIPGVRFNWLGSPSTLGWIQFTFATPVVLWGGWPFLVRAWASVVNSSLNMFTLIGLGTGVAYLYSVIATIVPDIFPGSFRSETGEVAVYFEAAAVIVTLVLLGQVMELRARSNTGVADQGTSRPCTQYCTAYRP